MPSDIMFVYGTLRKDSASPMSHVIEEYCDLIGEGYIHGSLYDLGRYPGVIVGEDHQGNVFGQLFKLKDEQKVLAEFDYYEECSDDFPKPHLYIREAVDVFQGTSEPQKAWVYIYNRDVSKATKIPEGDYLKYLDTKA